MTIPTEVAAVLAEMRARTVNHGKNASPTLTNWADRIESALASAEPVATVCDLRYFYDGVVKWTGDQLPAGTKLYTRAQPAAKAEAPSLDEVLATIRAYGEGCIRLGMESAPTPASDYPECSGDPASCPENEGHGCCKPNPVKTPASVPDGYPLSVSEAKVLIDQHEMWIAEADSIGVEYSGNERRLELLRAVELRGGFAITTPIGAHPMNTLTEEELAKEIARVHDDVRSAGDIPTFADLAKALLPFIQPRAAGAQGVANPAAEAIQYHNAVGPIDAIYAAFFAMDNNDTALEEWPQRAIDALAFAGWAVVPYDLPFAILGEAGMTGVFETGNPKHGWDWLVAKTRIGPHGPPAATTQPPTTIRVDVEQIGSCELDVRDGVAYMPAVTVQDIVSKSCLKPQPPKDADCPSSQSPGDSLSLRGAAGRSVSRPAKGAGDNPSPDSPIMKWAESAIADRNGAKDAGAVPIPDRPALPLRINRETLTAPGKWTTQEAEVIRAYGNAREAAGRADAAPDPLDAAIAKGTKAWAGVPDSFVEDLRGEPAARAQVVAPEIDAVYKWCAARSLFGAEVDEVYDSHRILAEITTSPERTQIPAESEHAAPFDRCPTCTAHMPVGKTCGGVNCGLRGKE